LEHAPWDPDHPFVLADDDAELHGLSVGILPGILGKGEEHGRLRFRLGLALPGLLPIDSPGCKAERVTNSLA